jgi:Prefoldin subunit
MGVCSPLLSGILFRKGKKRRKGQTHATLMTLMMTNPSTRRTMVGSQCQSGRPLSSQTRSTQKPNSKKRTQCVYGSEYAFSPSPFRQCSVNKNFPPTQANVMLSYKIPAAIELLKSKLEAANTSLNNAIEDLEFIREQMTVMEVNTARIYNWDVKRRREKREKETLSGPGEIKT